MIFECNYLCNAYLPYCITLATLNTIANVLKLIPQLITYDTIRAIINEVRCWYLNNAIWQPRKHS